MLSLGIEMCVIKLISHDAALYDSNKVKAEENTEDGKKSSTVEEFHNLGTIITHNYTY